MMILVHHYPDMMDDSYRSFSVDVEDIFILDDRKTVIDVFYKVEKGWREGWISKSDIAWCFKNYLLYLPPQMELSYDHSRA